MLSDTKMSIWEARKTCWVSLAKQCSTEWKQKRIGRIPASLISEACGRSTINNRTSKELAELICGLTTNFKPDHLLAMENGIIGEPYVRDWYSQRILKRPIEEVGVAVWKEDPYFSSSLDGETFDEKNRPVAIEIKVPDKFNEKYIEVCRSWSMNLNNPHPDSYIFSSHYDQMTAGCVITDKVGCYYIVAHLKSKTMFHQYLPTDTELWNNILYPRAKKFHSTYVLPLLKEHNIQVIMPEEGLEMVERVVVNEELE